MATSPLSQKTTSSAVTSRVSAQPLQSIASRFPYETEKQTRGFFAWLTGENIIIWTIAILLGNAIGRLVNSFFEDIFDPIIRTALNDPDNKRPTVKILGVNMRLRALFVTILQFIVILLIAYLLSQHGRYDPGRFETRAKTRAHLRQEANGNAGTGARPTRLSKGSPTSAAEEYDLFSAPHDAVGAVGA